MSHYVELQVEFDKQLKAASDGLKIAWPNTKFEPIQNEPYLKPNLIPARSVTSNFDMGQQETGFYQISIYCPLNRGALTVMTIMDNLYDSFKSIQGLPIGDNTVIISNISQIQVTRQDAWLLGIIQVNYILYV